MFRSSTIIRELSLNPANVIFTLTPSVKLRRYLLCGCVAACHGMVCVCVCVLHAQHGGVLEFPDVCTHMTTLSCLHALPVISYTSITNFTCTKIYTHQVSVNL